MPGLSIDGVSSGLNTSEIVDAIIAAERRPAVLMELDQAERTNIISSLKSLEARFLALKGIALRLSQRAAFNKSSLTISDDTVLKATSSGRVSKGSYDIQVLALARNNQLASQGFSGESIASLGTGSLTIGVGSSSPKTITIDATNNSLVGIKKAINNADAGVTATIIKDGSSSNSYRLVLNSNDTGFKNTIQFTSNLAGGSDLNFSTSSFDVPEEILFDSGSDSKVSLGASASYSGSVNKTYTFTVAGTGAQTIGTDNITINWTDGTDSGSILVTQADSEVTLAGAGSDGLKLSFSSGSLTSGDTFQVQTFAPLLQSASDAKIAVGSSGGSGSPITVTSTNNTLSDVIPGVSLTLLKETKVGDHVNLSTDVDVGAIKQSINDFINAYNDINSYIDKQNSYTEETKQAGILLGDSIVQSMQSSIRNVVADRVKGLSSKFNQLFTIGIQTNVKGQLSIKNSSKFDEALKNNLDDVVNLFTDTGISSTNLVEFVSASADTKIGTDYKVDITQAATQGKYNGKAISDPATTPIVIGTNNNKLILTVDGIVSQEIVLTQKTYSTTDDLVKEIQSKIDADSSIGKRGLTAAWVSTGTDIGYLELTSSTYGSGSRVTVDTSIANNAAIAIGLAGGVNSDGVNVEGTINGEKAKGAGQFLTGEEGNNTTDGLKLRITFTDSQIVSGSEGTISLTKGVASKMEDMVDGLTKTGEGIMDRRIKSYQDQVKGLKERISEFDVRLEMRRKRLQLQFQRMEEVLGQLNAVGSFLTSELANINRNWKRN